MFRVSLPLLSRLVAVSLMLAIPIGLTAAQAPKPDASPHPAFEAAEIHPSPYSFFSQYFRWSRPDSGTRFNAHQATLLDLITVAYGVRPDAVVNGPSWLGFDRFEVTAKLPPSPTSDAARLMLRSLLEDRFKLVAHTDTRPLPAMLLETQQKVEPKLKQTADTSQRANCWLQVPGQHKEGDPPPTTFSVSCRNMSMEQFATWAGSLGQTFQYPVVDSTGLHGPWDFDFTLTRDISAGTFKLNVVEAIDKQLGLRIRQGTSPQPVLTIVSVNEKPTPNASNIAELLPPPPPPEFEVATIKPAAPGGPRELQMMWRPNGQVELRGASLQALVSEAWDISGATISEMPPWFSKTRWDITGKVNADAFPRSRDGSPYVSYDDIKLMLRALLKDRFALQAHTEQRPMDAYVLLPGTPKMKKADPAARTYCDARPPAGEKDPRTPNPIRSHLMTCQNVTMDQFAAELQGYALDYIKMPVLNSSNLDGSYDLTLNWSGSREARGVINNGAPSSQIPTSTGDGMNQPSDPSGAISLPDAVARQLGLKLQLQKRPVPVLVIDHIDEDPTDN